jgi:hypothetical protein
MTSDSHEDKDMLPRSTHADTALDAAGVLISAVPWIGGPVNAVLSGVKLSRVRDVLDRLAAELEGFREQVSQDYVRTEDFEELLERTLRLAADERSELKRTIYAQFLAGDVKTPGESFDEQIRFLRTLEEMGPDHLRVLKALSLAPEGGSGISSSPGQTLKNRLPDIEEDRIGDLVSQLNDMRVTNLTELKTMMTFSGSQDLRHAITNYGQRFLVYLGRETLLNSHSDQGTNQSAPIPLDADSGIGAKGQDTVEADLRPRQVKPFLPSEERSFSVSS